MPNPNFSRVSIHGVERHELAVRIEPYGLNEIHLMISEGSPFIFLDDEGVDDLITVLTYWKENHG